MSRKDTLNALFKVAAPAPETKSAEAGKATEGARALGAPNALPQPEAGRVRAGAGSIRDLAGEAETLRAQLAAAEQIVSLDPALIDPAPVADRLRAAADPAIDDLKASIRDSGQQVPVLVRPHPTHPSRYQAAYGHRRIRAARELGRPVQAIVKALDDTALAIAQGQENIARRDLSFIEKAYFAEGLATAGLARADIGKALATDKGDLSRYIAVAQAIPMALAELIGPAPKAGRARWLALAEALAKAGWTRGGRSPHLPDAIRALDEKAGFQQADSDGRFAMVLAALTAASAKLPRVLAPDVVLANEAGVPIARLAGEGRKAELMISEKAAPGFARYLATSLPDLYRRWRAAGADGNGPD
jgi:ParB family transcriptional regulator, chromosome partitioning protein